MISSGKCWPAHPEGASHLPMIYHLQLDVGTMYPDIIILMNRMQVGVSYGCGLMVGTVCVQVGVASWNQCIDVILVNIMPRNTNDYFPHCVC